MPIHKTPSGYQWGSQGKVYSRREDAVKQAQAAHASGYKEKAAKKTVKLYERKKT